MRETEHLKRLSDYVKRNLEKGYADDSLKWALINQGHSRSSVEKAIEIARQEMTRESASREKPVITHEVVTDDSSNTGGTKKSWWKSLFGLE